MLFKIKHRFSGSVLFSLETESLKLCVEAAVKDGADLRGANLRGADLRFRVAPPLEIKKLEAIFRHKVFRMLLKKGKFTEEMVRMGTTPRKLCQK